MKHPFKKTLIALGLLFFILTVSCDKDFNEAEPQTATSQQNSRFKVNTGDKVSTKAINYLKQKTNNSLKVNLGKNLVALSDGNMLSRASALGTVDTSKEVVVTNTYNVKHTFKVITDDGEPNSVLNIIVVEIMGFTYEYFKKYTFDENVAYNSDNSIDLSKFSGTIETFNSNGELVGSLTMSNGELTAINGDQNPCPDDQDFWDNWEENNDDDPNGGSGGANIPDNGSMPTHSGGSIGDTEYIYEGDDFCYKIYYVCSNGYWGEHNSLQINDNGDMCGGAGNGNGVTVLTDCSGSIIWSGRMSSSYREPGSDDPCGGEIGVLIDEEAVHENNCDELARALNNTEFKNKINALKNLLATDPHQSGKESGFSVFEDANGTLHPTPVVQSPRADGTFKFKALPVTIGAAHLHTDKVHPMFSFYDLYGLYLVGKEFENNGNATDTSKPFLILVTLPQSNPHVYAIKIEDINKLNAFMENLTPSDIESYERRIETRYRIAERSTSDPGPTLYQKTFLNYILEKNIGISLYQADDNLTSWSKKSLSTNGNQVTTQNCNQ